MFNNKVQVQSDYEVKTGRVLNFMGKYFSPRVVVSVKPMTHMMVYIRTPNGISIRCDAETTSDLYKVVKDNFYANMKSTYTMSVDYMWSRYKFVLNFRNKPLSQRSVLLSQYGIVSNDIIDLVPHLLLGGNDLPDFEMISYNVTLERWLMKQSQDRWILQSDDEFTRNDQVFNMFVHKHMQKLLASCQGVSSIEWLVDHFENIIQINHWFRKCENFDDYYRLILLAYKVFTGKSATKMIMQRLSNLFSDNVQGDNFGDVLKALRSNLTSAQNVIEAPIVKKIVSMYTYLLVQGFLCKFGITLDDAGYTKLEQKALLLNFSSTKELWLCILDTTLFICEKLYEYKLTGDVTSFLHTSDEYSNWLKEADKVLALAPFTSNLEAHGTTYFSFVADVNDLVEKGVAYVKFTSHTSGVDCVTLKRKLYSLQLLKNTEVTRRASQKERKAPFGVLVHGGSSVAKSTFSKMLYYYYGSLHGLDKDDHYRYVRNPADEYWSNFDSSKWCIQMDDIAFLHPNKASDADPTLMEMLNVVNNVPYVPPQAALEDKGKTPVMARLVVATTNAKDLNAHEYFWCPLAVRRRLPFVVNIRPKKCYMHANGKFINPESLPPIDGTFPDYWEIEVQKIVPLFDGQRDLATLETTGVYDNIHQFLKIFGEASLAHNGIQEKSMCCDTAMKDIAVCPLCLLTTNFCECALQSDGVLGVCDTFLSYIRWLLTSCIGFVIMCQWFINLQIYLTRYRMYRRLFIGRFLQYYPRTTQMVLLGEVNSLLSGDSKWKAFLCVLTVFVSTVSCYFLVNNKKEEKHEVQGNKFATNESDIASDVTGNVWYNPNIELTKFDVPIPSQSLSTITEDGIRDLFGRNCVRLDIKSRTNIPYHMGTGGVFLKGHFCMVNNHAFRDDINDFDVTIIQSSVAQGLTSNLTIRVQRRDIVRRKDNDMCIFEVKSLPPFKDITKFWIKDPIDVTRIVSLRRKDTGCLEKQSVFNVNKADNLLIEALKISLPVYFGFGDRETRKGDCGAIAIAMTPRGPVILGLHTIGYNMKCGFVHVSIDTIEAMLNEHGDIFSSDIVVQGGGEPQLDLIDKPQPLTEPHHKSLFRYLEDGSLNIYGSFAGFRPKPKSRVELTPLSKTMQEHFSCKVEHGKPCMEGWEPWRKNIVEMVKPNVVYDKYVLEHCVRNFTQDILKDLPSGWEKDLVFLSKKASVNGLPGVAFIDRINCSSSMGFPWSASKKGFLKTDPCETYVDGVDFDDEVWARYDKIAAQYGRGERTYPVFTGHLKDEPTALKKCENKKTRVFTGAPIDWSLIVRSRLLTFVRLLQKNKYVFEAGPGTVCQSTEWGQIHAYLTHFGDDNIIAGDYGKFDKRMISDFILAAYKIIANVYTAAGFSDNEVREIMCIGEDTAFPFVNMNGDLVEFFGTNPSGHPLTVVINSLVNSLYMRYCYVILNPKHECASFKKNVHLFTYGDDNIMGVSDTAKWFNHTGVQAVLQTIGVEYTMADKETESVPFININDCQFLKRKWRYDNDVGAWLCPLEELSIHKSLTIWLPSKSIDCYSQMVAVISSANSEYFFYGKEIFVKHHAFFKEVLAREPYSYYMAVGVLPDWDELCERFWKSSRDVIPIE